MPTPTEWPHRHVFKQVCKGRGRNLYAADIRTAWLRKYRIKAVFLFWPYVLREANEYGLPADIKRLGVTICVCLELQYPVIRNGGNRARGTIKIQMLTLTTLVHAYEGGKHLPLSHLHRRCPCPLQLCEYFLRILWHMFKGVSQDAHALCHTRRGQQGFFVPWEFFGERRTNFFHQADQVVVDLKREELKHDDRQCRRIACASLKRPVLADFDRDFG